MLPDKRLITWEKTGVTDFFAYFSATSIKYIAFSSSCDMIAIKVFKVNKLQLIVSLLINISYKASMISFFFWI